MRRGTELYLVVPCDRRDFRSRLSARLADSPPLTNVQTVTVPPGGAAVVEFKCEVPGRYVLVDHALSRAERGLAGYLIVEGEEQPDIFGPIGEPPDPAMSGH